MIARLLVMLLWVVLSPFTLAGRTALTLAQVRKLPAVLEVTEAARVLGIGRTTAYEALAAGTFPAKTIKVGGRIKVLTASLLTVLEGEAADSR